MAEHFKRRSILVLISDFYEDPDVDPRGDQAAARSSATTSSCSTCSIPPEIDFGYEDASSFEDLESGEQMPVVPRVVRATSTASSFSEHIDALTTKFSEQRIDYALLNTAEPLDRALFSYLSRESARAADAELTV